MNTITKTRSWATFLAGILATLAILILVFVPSAFAALGGDEASVQNDGLQMKAVKRSVVQSAQSYTVHAITTPYGTVIREYVSPDGKVFGVAWQGPFLPEFKQILGTYYDQFAQAAQSKRAGQGQTVHARRAPLNIEQPGFVAHSSGHLRSYSGQAYLPDMLPDGVLPADIK